MGKGHSTIYEIHSVAIVIFRKVQLSTVEKSRFLSSYFMGFNCRFCGHLHHGKPTPRPRKLTQAASMRLSGLAFGALRPLYSLAFAPQSLRPTAVLPSRFSTLTATPFSYQEQRNDLLRCAGKGRSTVRTRRGVVSTAPLTGLRMSSSSASSGEPKKVAALMYQYVDGMLDKRGPYRSGHLDLLTTMSDEGTCLLGGAFVEPCDGGIVLFSTREVAQEFVDKDPYNTAGLVTSYKIRDYMAVVGTMMK